MAAWPCWPTQALEGGCFFFFCFFWLGVGEDRLLYTWVGFGSCFVFLGNRQVEKDRNSRFFWGMNWAADPATVFFHAFWVRLWVIILSIVFL